MTDDRTPDDDDRRPLTSEEMLEEARADVYDDDPLEGYVAPPRRFDDLPDGGGDEPIDPAPDAGDFDATAPLPDRAHEGEPTFDPTALPPGPVDQRDPPQAAPYDPLRSPIPLDPGTAGTEPSPPRSRWRGVVRAVVLVALLWVGWSVVRNLVDPGTDVQSLQPGDCFLEFDGTEVARVETVDCADPHQYEVFANVLLPDGPYPGEDEADAVGFERCVGEFEPYVGVPYDSSIWYATNLIPLEDSWPDDRTVNCLLVQPDASNPTVPGTVTGSARGSGE